MNKATENMDNDLAGKKINRPFKVPQDYFDNLEREILAKTIENVQEENKILILRTYYKYIAAAVLILSIGFVFAIISKNENTLNTPTNITEQNSATKNATTKPQVVDKTEGGVNNSLDTNGNLIQTIGHKPHKIDNAVEQNKIEIEKQNIKPNSDFAQNPSNASNQGQNQYNQPLPSPNNSQQINYGSSNLTSNGADVARKSSTQALKVITLTSDTCSVSPVLVAAISNESLWNKYSYKWSNGTNSPTLFLRKSGFYSVKVYEKETKNLIDSAAISFKLIEAPNPDLGHDQIVCSHESLIIKSNTYNPEYQYTWSYNNSNKSDLFIKKLNPGTHTIQCKVVACGISVYDEVVIVVNDCSLQFSNVITPNGDGVNEAFVIDGLENYPGSKLYVMDRNGKIVFESLNYQNNWNGNGQPDGTYFYLLRLNDGKNTEKGGSLTIMRK